MTMLMPPWALIGDAKLENPTIVVVTGRNTPAVFGEYAGIYDIPQAIRDNGTLSIYYATRLVKLLPDGEGIAEA